MEYKENEVENIAQFIRYAAKISLSVTVTSDSRVGNIKVPLLRVLYKDVATSERDAKVCYTQ